MIDLSTTVGTTRLNDVEGTKSQPPFRQLLQPYPFGGLRLGLRHPWCRIHLWQNRYFAANCMIRPVQAWGAEPRGATGFLSKIRGAFYWRSYRSRSPINGTGTTADEYRWMATIINHFCTLDSGDADCCVFQNEISTRRIRYHTAAKRHSCPGRAAASQFAVGYISPYEAFGPPAAAADR